MAIVGCLYLVGFVAAVVLGTQAYFKGELSKPIHERNWKSDGFHSLAKVLTGEDVAYQDRASSPAAEVALSRVLADS
ncbi:MAG: hypothetical protein AAGE92_00875 [Cyanobacteria bacterium P01_G01_bin.4]